MKLSVRFFLLIGVLPSTLLGLAEWLLHLDPKGPSGEISMLFEVPLRRAEVGHFLAIAASPLYFAGYYGLIRLLQSSSPILSRLLFIVGVFSFSVGSAWLSSRYFAAEVLQKTMRNPTILLLLGELREPLPITGLGIAHFSELGFYTLHYYCVEK